MDIPEKLLYSKDHEWFDVNNDNCKIGITEYAQGELGDIVFMELPSVGLKVSKGDSIGTIEAVKTVAKNGCFLLSRVSFVNCKNGSSHIPQYPSYSSSLLNSFLPY